MNLLQILEAHKDALAALQSLATSLALVFGAIAAVLAFRRRRIRFPRAEVEHRLFAWRITPTKWHIHLTVRITNRGEVLLCVKQGCAWAQEIDPCTQIVTDAVEAGADPVPAGHTEVEWPRIGAVRQFSFDERQEIEPGEFDEFHADFFADGVTRRVLVYSHFSNAKKTPRVRFWKKPIGWNSSTFYQLPDTAETCG